MGLLDDLAMGLGLKDRDTADDPSVEDYYSRTEETIRKNRGKRAADKYRKQINAAGEPVRSGILAGFNFGEYRDVNDMFDGGGPMASGGSYQGGGLLSFLGNLRNAITGRDMGERVGYGAPMEATIKPKPRVMPTSTYDAERMMQINEIPVNPLQDLTARQDNPSGMGYGMTNSTQQSPISNDTNTRLQIFNQLMDTVPAGESFENTQKYADDILYDKTRLTFDDWLRLQ